jgi:hypothetical protein
MNFIYDSHLYYDMNANDDNYLCQILFGYSCMLSIGCKPMVLSNLIWLKLD